MAQARRLAFVLAAGILAPAAGARAFCRTTTCSGVGCPRDDAEGCLTTGIPLAWARPSQPCLPVELDLESAAHVGFDADEVAELFEQALRVWSEADCTEGRPPAICLVPAYSCGGASGTSDIQLRFWDESWPFERRETALAHTRTEVRSDGVIVRADINLNSGNQPLTVGDTQVGYDLLTTLVHELGHALGLDHTALEDSVMNAAPRYGQTRFRALQDDDLSAICSVYPPAAESPAAPDEDAASSRRSTPPRCEQPAGCSAARTRGPRWPGLCVIAAALAAGGRTRRRRPPRAPAGARASIARRWATRRSSRRPTWT